MFKRLLRPFSYLTIKHEQKWQVDWLYPMILSVLSTMIIFIMRHFGQISLYTDGGMISKILNFIQVLPGFYIAALAAIATFNRTDIDKTMPAPPPEINIEISGQNVLIKLTRRRFLCSMFAFLTAECITIIVLCIFTQALYEPIKTIIPISIQIWVSGLFVLIFFTLFWQMIIASFWGLFYLGERLHQPDN